MELKNFFAQDLQGNVIPSPTVYLYQPGTTTLASGLEDKDGNALSNPFQGTANGQVTVAAPDGDYDMRVTGAGRDTTMRVRFIDSVSASAQILREELAASGGAAGVGYLPSAPGAVAANVQSKLRENDAYWNKGRTHHQFANDYSTGTVVVRDGVADGYHRNFGQIAEGVNGRMHLLYRRAAQHALTDGGTIYHCHSDDGGATWSAESVLVPAVAGFDQRSMSMCVTPSGRIVVIYDKVPADGSAGVTIRRVYSDDNGATWSAAADVVAIGYAYVRAYGRIKVVPGDANTQYRLVATPYYQSSATPTYRVALWVSDDDGMTWDTSGSILDDAIGDNETEIVAVSSQVWLAVSRGASGLEMRKSTDKGATWSSVGIVPLTSTDSFVAPTLDKFYRNGRWYVLLGYCNRTSTTDAMTWRICDVASLLTSTEGFSGSIITATDMQNASGYQCPVTKPDGDVYFDECTAFVEFREYTGFNYSQVRFVRTNLNQLSAEAARSITVVSGVITLTSSDFEQQVFLDTEASAATDDLDTIDGGFEGQVVAFKGGTSSRDVILKSGTGNLRLNGDYRLSDTNSRIVLRKVGSVWLEVARNTDHALSAAYVIVSDAITVANGPAIGVILVDTEGAAATDNLSTINGGLEGQVIIVQSATSSRDTTLVDGTGNLQLVSSFTLTNVADTITLIKRGTIWYEIARSDNLA